MPKKEVKRESWGSSMGFMLAAIGSAVGLGNMWGFPYKLGMNGGFAFLILYLLLAVFAGYVLIMTELSLGRKTHSSIILAYREVSKKYTIVGWCTRSILHTRILFISRWILSKVHHSESRRFIRRKLGCKRCIWS